MQPLGYLVQQHGVRLSRPVKAYDRWVKRIPDKYRVHVLKEKKTHLSPENDPYCLATVKHFRSLVPMAQEVRKLIFALTPADGAIGSHAAAVQDAYCDFEILARKILDRINVQQELYLPDFMAMMIRTDYFLALVAFNRVGGVKQRMYYANLAEIRLFAWRSI
jgi:hypothetical protein